jgi:hypothetical protein
MRSGAVRMISHYRRRRIKKRLSVMTAVRMNRKGRRKTMIRIVWKWNTVW